MVGFSRGDRLGYVPIFNNKSVINQNKKQKRIKKKEEDLYIYVYVGLFFNILFYITCIKICFIKITLKNTVQIAPICPVCSVI